MAPRTTPSVWVRLLALVLCFITILEAFLLIARPWYLRWGATAEELRRVLPGDEILASPGTPETRAITIDVPADRVWPWLAQLGQDRGGFYSFDLLENLVGCEMPTEDVLRPERQIWHLGDKLWMYPADKAGGMGYATLRAMVPGRALAFGTHRFGTAAAAPEDGIWSFVVEPSGGTSTRLLVRGQGELGRSLLGTAFDWSVFEPMHFAMERRMMIGIKEVAEGGSRQRGLNHVHVVLWFVTFGLFVTAAVMMVAGIRWRRALSGLLASALVFQILTLIQPPVTLGALLVAAIVILLSRGLYSDHVPATRQAP